MIDPTKVTRTALQNAASIACRTNWTNTGCEEDELGLRGTGPQNSFAARTYWGGGTACRLQSTSTVQTQKRSHLAGGALSGLGMVSLYSG